jgi:predicted adenylyl cyclase CyaB
MQEIEVKILEINQQKIIESLAKLNAKKVFDSNILTLFLDFRDEQIHKRRDVLRLRKQNDEVELTYKAIKIGEAVKVAQEYSVKVSDLETTLEILQNLGLSVTQKMNKHRLSYMINSVRFDIDRYTDEFSFIPAFLEIEGSAESIKKYAQALGFQEKDCLPWSTDELLAYYATKQKSRLSSSWIAFG